MPPSFVKKIWSPGCGPLVWNWHIGKIPLCQHLLGGILRQLQAQFQVEGLDEAPVREDVAPGIAVLLAVVDHTQGIQITGIFVPVPVPGVGRLVIELGVGVLLDVADLSPGGGQQSLNRLHGHHPLRQ